MQEKIAITYIVHVYDPKIYSGNMIKIKRPLELVPIFLGDIGIVFGENKC